MSFKKTPDAARRRLTHYLTKLNDGRYMYQLTAKKRMREIFDFDKRFATDSQLIKIQKFYNED